MKMSPRNAKSELKIMSLKTDNISTPNFWLLLHKDSITLTKQKTGESSTEKITITREAFNKFIDWYNREQAIK
jgi:hypothetical protein